jgi:hypothetical protein
MRSQGAEKLPSAKNTGWKPMLCYIGFPDY